MIKKQRFFRSPPPCGANRASSIRNELKVSFLFWPYTHWPLGPLWNIMDLMNLLSLNDKFLDYFVDALKFSKFFSSASFMIKVAPILFFIVNRCNILKLNDSCPLFSNLTRANDYGKWEMKTDMEHAGRVSVSSIKSVKVGVFLGQIILYIKGDQNVFKVTWEECSWFFFNLRSSWSINFGYSWVVFLIFFWVSTKMV